MKTLILGLEAASPGLLLVLDDMPVLRRLMEMGSYGRLESVAPCASSTTWMCLATGLDPGSLEVSHSLVHHSHDVPRTDSPTLVTGQAIWDLLAGIGQPPILVGVPLACPPRQIRGIVVGCLMTDNPENGPLTQPEELSEEIRPLMSGKPGDVAIARAPGHEDGPERIRAMSQAQFGVVRHLMQSRPWNYLQLVDIGLNQLRDCLFKNHQPASDESGADGVYLETLRTYYRHIDNEIGKILELLDDETVVLVVSPHHHDTHDAAIGLQDGDDRSELGAFILAGPTRTLRGEIGGATLQDIAPTLLDLAGLEVPPTMQGKSLVLPDSHDSDRTARPHLDDEQLLRERLSGLGYI